MLIQVNGTCRKCGGIVVGADTNKCPACGAPYVSGPKRIFIGIFVICLLPLFASCVWMMATSRSGPGTKSGPSDSEINSIYHKAPDGLWYRN